MASTDVVQRAGAARAHLLIAEESFLRASQVEGPSADAQASASNAVLAGIAASDAICGQVLGVRSADQDHGAAARLLAEVMPDGERMAVKPRRLLSDKTQIQYGNYSTVSKAKSMLDCAHELVESMTTVHRIR